MKYILKQKFWSLGGSFDVKDEDHKDLYQVRGKPFSWCGEVGLRDMDGRELASIARKVWSWWPRYEVRQGGALLAEVRRELSWTFKFSLDVPGRDDYAVSGSFWGRDYTFDRDGRSVAWVSKVAWTWAGTYGVEIADGEDPVTILAACVAIDLMCRGPSTL